jgi:hypothetical protein
VHEVGVRVATACRGQVQADVWLKGLLLYEGGDKGTIVPDGLHKNVAAVVEFTITVRL